MYIVYGTDIKNQLVPCDCGSQKLEVVELTTGHSAVLCVDCLERSEFMSTKKKAINNWNQRRNKK